MDKQATIITDLGFGDAGKGSITDYLARTAGASLVIRHNGGAQAGHNVAAVDGRHHTFSQFGAGSLVPGVRTHLSRFMVVHPRLLHDEANQLAALGQPDIISRLTIDEAALVITPYQQAANRLRELYRGADRHGSCGLGVGETVADSLAEPALAVRMADLTRPSLLRRKLGTLRELKHAQVADLCRDLSPSTLVKYELQVLADPQLVENTVMFYRDLASYLTVLPGDALAGLLAEHQHIVFEGAQGVLLDEVAGFYPYTTWSTTTPANALTLLAEAGYTGAVHRLGVLRAYATRHGAGPFPTECPVLTADLPDRHNPANPWQKQFRTGYFDAVLARYALAVSGGIDSLAITCLDQVYGRIDWPVATAYWYGGLPAHRSPALGPANPVVNLRPSPSPDLAYQSVLTANLRSCHPEYEVAVPGPFRPDSLKAYLAFLEGALDHPVSLVSTGPTAAGKQAWPH